MLNLGGAIRASVRDTSKDLTEQYVNNVEPYSGGDTHLGAFEQAYPEGDHGGDEIRQRRLPIDVEDSWRADEWPDCGDNNGRECCFGDPVECAAELEDANKDNGSGKETRQWGFDLASAVDRRSGHGAADPHGVEEGVDKIGDT